MLCVVWAQVECMRSASWRSRSWQRSVSCRPCTHYDCSCCRYSTRSSRSPSLHSWLQTLCTLYTRPLSSCYNSASFANRHSDRPPCWTATLRILPTLWILCILRILQTLLWTLLKLVLDSFIGSLGHWFTLVRSVIHWAGYSIHSAPLRFAVDYSVKLNILIILTLACIKRSL